MKSSKKIVLKTTMSMTQCLLLMIRKGKRELLTEIKTQSPLISSVSTNLDQLTVSSLSILNDGTFDPKI